MSRDRTKTPTHLALERFSREAAGLNAVQLRKHPELLVALAGEQMAVPSEAQAHLITQVLDVIKKALVESFDDAEQVVLKIGLGIEPLNGLGISWRIGMHQDVDPTFNRAHGYYDHRDRVLASLAALLDTRVGREPAPATDESGNDYSKWVLKAADQLVLHLQELGSYVFGYLHLADELIRVSSENPDRYQAWRERLAEPDLLARLSMYEYVAVADILSDLQARPAGRAFLRNIGLGEFAFAAGNTGDIVEWSWIAIGVGGFGGNRREFFDFLEDDTDARKELDRWHHELTGHTENHEQAPAWVEDGHGSLQFLGRDVSRLLTALFDAVPEAFASVSEIRERAENHIQQLCARRRYAALHPGEWAQAPPVDELRRWDIEQLWDALTLYRRVEYKPEARESLPAIPHLGLELVGPVLPDDE